jgi:hypothetical protein
MELLFPTTHFVPKLIVPGSLIKWVQCQNFLCWYNLTQRDKVSILSNMKECRERFVSFVTFSWYLYSPVYLEPAVRVPYRPSMSLFARISE